MKNAPPPGPIPPGKPEQESPGQQPGHESASASSRTASSGYPPAPGHLRLAPISTSDCDVNPIASQLRDNNSVHYRDLPERGHFFIWLDRERARKGEDAWAILNYRGEVQYANHIDWKCDHILTHQLPEESLTISGPSYWLEVY